MYRKYFRIESKDGSSEEFHGVSFRDLIVEQAHREGKIFLVREREYNGGYIFDTEVLIGNIEDALSMNDYFEASYIDCFSSAAKRWNELSDEDKRILKELAKDQSMSDLLPKIN